MFIVRLVITSLLVAALLLVAFKTAPSLFSPRLLSPVTVQSSMEFQGQILERLRSINELHTAVESVQTIVTDTQNRSVFGLDIGRDKLMYIAVGAVRAGIDLTQLKPDDIRIVNNVAEIALPPPRILDSKIDVNRSSVYDNQRCILFPAEGINVQDRVMRTALEQITASAEKSGLLDAAGDQAKKVVSDLVRMMGIHDVNVSFHDRTGTG